MNLLKDLKLSLLHFYAENRNRIWMYVILVALSCLGIWFTYEYAILFSAIPLTFVYLVIFIGFFELFDHFILTGIDTIKKINEGNTAVSQFYLAIAIVLLAVAHMVG